MTLLPCWRCWKNSSENCFAIVSDISLLEISLSSTAPPDNLLETITMATTKLESNEMSKVPVTELQDIVPLAELAKQARHDLKMDLSDYLFIVIAWIILPVFHYFLLCPKVLWIDITSHSNNKGFSLLTFLRPTSADWQVAFLWMWVPKERRISFWWVFHHAVCMLIPSKYRALVRLTTKDRDFHQRNELLSSLPTLFSNAVETGCSWHIGDFLAPMLFAFTFAKDYLFFSQPRHDQAYSWIKLNNSFLSKEVNKCHRKDK